MKSRSQLDLEISKLKAKVCKWYLQMGKCKNFRKYYSLRAKVVRATQKAESLQRLITELKYEGLSREPSPKGAPPQNTEKV